MKKRKKAGLVERLSKIPYTGAISDILDEMGFHNQVLPKEIQSLHPGHTVAGRALTIVGEPTTSEDPEIIFIPYLKMLGDVKPGDVLVNQPNDNLAAHLGELSTETAQFRGARGAVIDGGARDTDYIRKLDFPVFARYKTPVDIVGRWRLVAHNVPIDIGRVHIEPGDYIVGRSRRRSRDPAIDHRRSGEEGGRGGADGKSRSEIDPEGHASRGRLPEIRQILASRR